MKSPVTAATSKLANAYKYGTPVDVRNARRELNEAKLARAISESLAAEAGLSDHQRERLSKQLLEGVTQ